MNDRSTSTRTSAPIPGSTPTRRPAPELPTVGGGLVSTATTDAEDLPRIDYAQPPTIALHLVEHDHLVTRWRLV